MHFRSLRSFGSKKSQKSHFFVSGKQNLFRRSVKVGGMQMNCIGCATSTFHQNDGEKNVFLESLPAGDGATIRGVVGDEVTSQGTAEKPVSRILDAPTCRVVAQRRRKLSVGGTIKENKTRFLINRSFLSMTRTLESNKTKDNDNKIKQN
jgi:hypothetical protein